ncbi:MAG: DUF423 domain-containing protein [Rickettsiales bacterium]|nr:DUF423 domain-containing protein [Rickettsiales bacterium]
MILSIGAILGFISVMFGAFAEHGLKANISDEHFRFLMTAIRYNQIHAVMISSIGLAFLSNSKLAEIKLVKLSSILFIIGTILFSFSIYLSVTFQIESLIFITPFGGMTIMLGWALLILTGIKIGKKT